MLPLLLLLTSPVAEEQYKQRIQAHLLINDKSSALIEAEAAVKVFPSSELLQKAYIRALAEQGDETQAIEQWVELCREMQEKKIDRTMLEVLAWGVLNKGVSSCQINMRLNALLGSAFTRDAKAIPFLLSQLKSSNATLRSVAVRLATNYADAPLKAEILRLLKEERVWYVRLYVIAAAGAMHLYEARSQLKEIVANPRTLAEEKATAIVSLVGMYDKIDREELLSLVQSPRAGLRQLAAEVMVHLQLYSDVDLLKILLDDVSSDVRVASLNAMALLCVKNTALVEGLLKDPAPEVAITAAYVLLINQDPRGESSLLKWVFEENPEWQRLASAALAISGRYGIKATLAALEKTQDPYVRVNLAQGLIGQRVQVERACNLIRDTLSQEKALWMWESSRNPLFRSLAPSQVKHIDSIPHYPSVVDQLTRLDLFSILSKMRSPGASQAVKEFLEARSWGVTGAAAATLIQEGSEEDLEVVRELLKDPDEKIRCQAALILAIVGSDSTAVSTLQESYSRVDREMKVHILEALARIGDPSSIPFLVEVLKEPFQILRVVAASALIQCLYH